MEKAIYSAGRNGDVVLSGLLESGCSIDYFIDDNLAGQHVRSIPVITSADSALRPATVYVAVVPQRDGVSDVTGHDQVCARLGQLNHNVVGFVDTLRAGEHVLGKYFDLSHLWMSPDTALMIEPHSIDRVRGLLSDPKSLCVLDQIIALRTTKEVAHYVLPDDGIEYFPDDIPLLDSLSSIRFADCGAYTGDTVADLVRYSGIPVDHVTCFEPDPTNLKTLAETVRSLTGNKQLKAAHIYPCGVWSSNSMAQFSAGNGSSSAISEDVGNSKPVSLVPLDMVLSGSRPNYIKMDVEGAEREALLGARHLIENDAPVLAICVYHKPADLWELPLLINEMQPAYKMSLRVHGHLGLSTILYCYR